MYSDPDILTEPTSGPKRQGIVLAEVLEVMGKRSFVPLIGLPALVGLIPGANSLLITLVCSLLIAVAAIQLIMGYPFLHLPRRIAYRYSRGRIAHFLTDATVSYVNWLDEVPSQKLVWIQGGFISILPNVMLLLTALALPLLVWMGVPTFLACTAILIYCISLLTRDGRYTIFAAIVLSIASVPAVLQLAG